MRLVGALTDDMTRLCDQILALRRERGMLNRALEHGNADRQNTVSQLCAGFAGARVEMAGRTKAGRCAFLKNLRQGVNRHRRETRADLMGARRAWMGKGA